MLMTSFKLAKYIVQRKWVFSFVYLEENHYYLFTKPFQ